jgi:hypothetical protein
VLGAAGLFFVVGLLAATGENGYVYWAIRAPSGLWPILSLILGAMAVWLALRGADD